MNSVLVKLQSELEKSRLELNMTDTSIKNTSHALLVEFQREYNKLITRAILLFGKKAFMKRKRSGVNHNKLNIYPTLYDIFDMFIYPKVESIYYGAIHTTNVIKEISLIDNEIVLDKLNQSLLKDVNQMKVLNALMNSFRKIMDNINDTPDSFNLEDAVISEFDFILNDIYTMIDVKVISDYPDTEVPIHLFTKSEELKELHDKFILKMSRIRPSYNWFS